MTMMTTITIAAKTPVLSFFPFFFPFLVEDLVDLVLLDLAAASSGTAEEVELEVVWTATAEVFRVVGACIGVSGCLPDQCGDTYGCNGCSCNYFCIGSFIADSETLVRVGVVCKHTSSSKPYGQEHKFEKVCVHDCA